MKKNIFVFVISAFIVIWGMVCTPFWTGVKYNTVMFVKNCLSSGFFTALQTYADSMEKATTDNLSYHSTFMDINSVYMSAVNTRIVEKSDSIVIKSKNGYLLNLKYYVNDTSLENRVQKLNEVYNCAKENGAEFLYVMAPSKGYTIACPQNIADFTKDNCDRFSAFMKDAGVPYLNLIDSMSEQGITEEEMFFATDHHWRPQYGMWASEQICNRLSSDYGFEYDKKYNDISNYKVTTLKDWFLGSQGKKVGRYFSPHGCDDIDVILPDFETSMTEEQPAKDQKRVGSFEDTVMYMENIETKDHYGLNPYAAYSGGDFREQIITNKLNTDGKKIMLIRDSFSCAMAPFLSLNTSKLYVVDVRDSAFYVGEKIRVSEYIQRIKPDYVVVMYNGVNFGDDLFDFE